MRENNTSSFITRLFLVTVLFLSMSRLVSAQCPAPVIGSVPLTTCGPYPATLKVVEDPSYLSYQWSNGEVTSSTIVSVAGTYTVTVTCATGTRTSTFNVPAAGTANILQASFDDQSYQSCLPGDPITLFINISAGGGWAQPPYVFTITDGTGNVTTFQTSLTGVQKFQLSPGPSIETDLVLTTIYNESCVGIIPPATSKATYKYLFNDQGSLPEIQGPDYFCAGSFAELIVDGGNPNEVPPTPPTWTWVPPFPLPQGNLDRYNATISGNYQVIVQYPEGCKLILSKIMERVSYSPEIIGTVICSGEEATLSTVDPYVLYQWSDGSTGPTLTVTEAGNYRVTVTDDRGCTGFDATNVIERDKPNVDIFGPTAICSGQTSASIHANGFGISSYAWSTGATTPNVVVTPGTYTVTVSNIQGCTNVAELTLEQVVTPTVSLAPFLNKICAGNSVTLTPITTGEDLLITWSNGSFAPTLTVNQAGFYGVTVSDPTGTCFKTAQTVVEVLARPEPTIATTSAVICPQGNATLTANGGASYLWSNNSIQSQTTVNQAGTYTVTVTGTNGCTATANQAISVAPPLQPKITGPTTACFGSVVTLTADPGYASYSWSNGTSGTSVQTSFTAAFSLTVTDGLGCTGTVAQTVQFGTALQPQIVGPLSLCGRASIDLSLAGTFTGYQWTGGSTNDSLTVSSAGDYTVVVSDNSGCTGSITRTVLATAPPTPAISGLNSLCTTDAIVLVGTPGFSAYSWSDGSVNDSLTITTANVYGLQVTDNLGCQGSTSFAISPRVTLNTNIGFLALCNRSIALSATTGFNGYLWSTAETTSAITTGQNGDYTVTVYDSNGCTGTATYAATVPPTPSADINGPNALCPNATGVIGVIQTYPTYVWSTGASTNSITVSGGAQYNVTVTDAFGCTTASGWTVAGLVNPTPAITGSSTLCAGSSGDFNVSGDYTTYLWSNGTSTSNTAINAPGTYTVTVTDIDGCAGTGTIDITLGNNLTPVIAQQPYLCDGQITLDAGAGFTTYLWSNGAIEPTISVTSGGDYGLTVSDALGCTGTVVQTIAGVPTPPQPQITGTTAICAGISTVITASTGFSLYSWSTNDNTAAITVTSPGDYTVTVTDTNGCTGTISTTVTGLPGLTPSISGATAICTGTSTLISAGNGFSQYAWSTNENTAAISVNLLGTYTVTVTDANGCTGITSATITGLPGLTPSISVSPYQCDNQIVIAAETGFSTYLWSSGEQTASIAALTNDTYTVTVTDANGCTGVVSQSVTIPVNPSVSVAQIQQGNSLFELTASGSGGTYQWSTTETTAVITVTASGTYTVTITAANGCTATATTTVAAAPPVITQITSNTLLCATDKNGTISVCLNGGTAPYAVEIVPAATSTVNTTAECAAEYVYSNLGTGDYTVTISDAFGLVQTSTISITSPAPIVVTATAVQNVITAEASGGVGTLEYSLNGIFFQSSPVFSNLPNGTYSVFVRDENGCLTQSQLIVVMTIDSNEPVVLWGATLQPNPSNGDMQLVLSNAPAGDMRLTIWDGMGRLISTRQLASAGGQVAHSIDLREQPGGVYMIQLRTATATAVFRAVVTK